MPTNKTITEKNKKAFLSAFAECGNVTEAAKLAGVDRTRHYDWLKDPAYAERFADAEAQAIDGLEKEARRRAIEGTDKPVFYRGGECGVIREYSDTLLIFLLKGARPEKYRDNSRIEHTGVDGGPIEAYNLTPEERQARINELIAKRGN